MRLFTQSNRFLRHIDEQYEAQPDEAAGAVTPLPYADPHIPLPPAPVNVFLQESERAHRKSMELLWDWLSDAQRRELCLDGHFTVRGEHSGKLYRICMSASFGLKELDEGGNVICSYCVVPAGTHAVGDTMLAQKIWMETDECATLERANRMSIPGLFSTQAQANIMAQPAAQEQLTQQAQLTVQQTPHPHLQYAQQLRAQADMMEREGHNATDVMRVRQRAQEAQYQAQQTLAQQAWQQMNALRGWGD